MSATFGRLLRTTRQRAGLSPAELAAAVSVTRQWVSSVESGTNIPTVARAEQLATVLARRIYAQTGAKDDAINLTIQQFVCVATEDRIARCYASVTARASAYRQEIAQLTASFVRA